MKKLKEEFFKLLPPMIFFFVALHLVAFIRVLMLKKTGIAPSSSVSIAVAALILGKAVLIADMLPLINRFPNKPLIYNAAWKTVRRPSLQRGLTRMTRMTRFQNSKFHPRYSHNPRLIPFIYSLCLPPIRRFKVP